MKIITIDDVSLFVKKVGLHELFRQIINALEADFKRWQAFEKSPRLAAHVPGGVLELMATYDDTLYSFKYVNGHPKNTGINKLSIVALGVLASVEDGHPLLLSEMTLLTAFRTAATSAMAAKYLAKKDSKVFTIIGTGAQAEFQTLAMDSIFDLKEIRFFDTDPKAMEKFTTNLAGYAFTLTPCHSVNEALKGADIITTATAVKKRNVIISEQMLEPGVFINAIGGDCPGKTELGVNLIQKHKIVVEFAPQSLLEGEIQTLDESIIHAELWQILSGQKKGRESNEEIIIFDSVGFAIEDFSILRFLYENSDHYDLGQEVNLLPLLEDAKDLFSLVRP